MAYIIGTVTREIDGTSVTSVTQSFGQTPTENNLLLLVGSCYSNTNFVTPTGYSVVSDGSNSAAIEFTGGLETVVYEKLASASETARNVSGSASNSYTATTIEIADVPSSSYIHKVAVASGGAGRVAMPGTTTTVPNCLVAWIVLTDGADKPRWCSGASTSFFDASTNADGGVLIGFGIQQAVGATAQPVFYQDDDSEGYHAYTIVIASDVGILPAVADLSLPPIEVINPMNTEVYSYWDGTVADPTASPLSLSTINGESVTYDASWAGGGNLGIDTKNVARHIVNSGTLGCLVVECTSIDATNKFLAVTAKFESGTSKRRTGLIDPAGVVFGIRTNSGAEALVWNIMGRDSATRDTNYVTFVIDPTITPIEDTGSNDLTDLDGLIVGADAVSNDVEVYWMLAALLSDIVLIGGHENRPAKFSDFIEIAESNLLLTGLGQGGNSTSQVYLKHPITVGTNNSSKPVHLEDDGFAVQFANNKASEKRKDFQVAESTIGITFNLGPNDKSILSNGQISGDANYPFDGSSSDPAATFTNTNVIIKRAKPLSLPGITATPMGGLTMDNCGEVNLNGGDYSLGCIYQNGQDAQAVTLAGSTEAALQALVDDIENWTFSGCDDAIRIEYTGTGDIELFLANITFSGNTTDIHFNSTNASQLTVVPTGTTSISTTDFDGSATGVVVNNSTAITLLAPNIIDDSRYQIYNVTQDAELYNAVVSGGSGISIATLIGSGLSIEEDDELRLRVTYQNATTYKTPIESSIIANTSGNVWTNSQSAWTVVESYLLDGSLYDYTANGGPFEGDFVNDEFDYELSANFSGAQFGSWGGYILTTEDGIRDWFNAFTFIDAANIRINNGSTSISGLFDSQISDEIFQTDSIRIFLEVANNGGTARPVKNPSTGGGGIDVNWKNQVYLQTTGSGALTSEQQTQLASASTNSATAASNTSSIPSTTDITSAIKTDSQSNPEDYHINVKYVNDSEITGSGTEADPWGPA